MANLNLKLMRAFFTDTYKYDQAEKMLSLLSPLI